MSPYAPYVRYVMLPALGIPYVPDPGHKGQLSMREESKERWVLYVCGKLKILRVGWVFVEGFWCMCAMGVLYRKYDPGPHRPYKGQS